MAPEARLPVMVWIYGGGFGAGRSSMPTYSGAELVRRGVTLVTFNYRLGALGVLAAPGLTTESPTTAPATMVCWTRSPR